MSLPLGLGRSAGLHVRCLPRTAPALAALPSCFLPQTLEKLAHESRAHPADSRPCLGLWCASSSPPSPTFWFPSSPGALPQPRSSTLRREAGGNCMSLLTLERAPRGDAARDALAKQAQTVGQAVGCAPAVTQVSNTSCLEACRGVEFRTPFWQTPRSRRSSAASASPALLATSLGGSGASPEPATGRLASASERVHSRLSLSFFALSLNRGRSEEPRFFLGPSLSPFFSARESAERDRTRLETHRPNVGGADFDAQRDQEGPERERREEQTAEGPEDVRFELECMGEDARANAEQLYGEVSPKVQMECMNKKNRLALRKRRRRMGERVSLRYR